jgi:Txe/YoeB family toxin of Txe-Axe toxin-antitoxin module
LGKLVQKAFRDLERWQTQLRSMANQLEGMVAQAKNAVWDETGLPEGFRQ